MPLKIVCLLLIGLGGGSLASAGVVTVLIAVGLIPRFAGRTDTAKHIWTYENSVILGTILGTLFSVFSNLYFTNNDTLYQTQTQ